LGSPLGHTHLPQQSQYFGISAHNLNPQARPEQLNLSKTATCGWSTSHLGHSLVARSSRGDGPQCGSGAHAPDELAAWSPRSGHAHDSGVGRLARVLRRTRCPRNGGKSTAGAAAMRLMRWRGRWLTQAVARRVRVKRRRHDDVPWWRRRSGHRWRWWRGPAVLEEKGEGEAHATCEPRRTEDRPTEEVKIRRRGWRGGEATG
jgi:hypothetical protein